MSFKKVSSAVWWQYALPRWVKYQMSITTTEELKYLLNISEEGNNFVTKSCNTYINFKILFRVDL